VKGLSEKFVNFQIFDQDNNEQGHVKVTWPPHTSTLKSLVEVTFVPSKKGVYEFVATALHQTEASFNFWFLRIYFPRSAHGFVLIIFFGIFLNSFQACTHFSKVTVEDTPVAKFVDPDPRKCYVGDAYTLTLKFSGISEPGRMRVMVVQEDGERAEPTLTVLSEGL
jgi:hypothetical protein